MRSLRLHDIQIVVQSYDPLQSFNFERNKNRIRLLYVGISTRE